MCNRNGDGNEAITKDGDEDDYDDDDNNEDDDSHSLAKVHRKSQHLHDSVNSIAL